MDDTIYRQAAIDALGEEPLVWHEGEDEIAERNQWRRDVNAIYQKLCEGAKEKECEDRGRDGMLNDDGERSHKREGIRW